jgi:GNAT superfamily N-acetyltransferase
MNEEAQPLTSAHPQPSKIQIVDSYSRQVRNELSGGEEDPSQTHSLGLKWRPTEKHFVVMEGEQPVCHVGLLKHTVDVDGLPVPVAGIGGVLTRPDCRGRGYAQLAMQAAESFAFSQLNVDFLLLFCRPVLCGWYQHHGWSEIVEQVWIEQDERTVLFPLATMVRCRGEQKWPRGEIQLRSLPW